MLTTRWARLGNGEQVAYALPDDVAQFPPLSYALNDPEGLILIGGALTTDWLLAAYQRGIFPWFNDDDPILWWCPNPRTILLPSEFKKSRSLAKVMRNSGMQVTFDTAFAQVIQHCATCHGDTWIVDDIQQAYQALHQLGYAHSVEVWQNEQLVGGLYGVSLGGAFFGESMFSLASNASKVALARLCELGVAQNWSLIDCQFSTDHLLSLGAISLPRQDFLQLLSPALQHSTLLGPWTQLNEHNTANTTSLA